jgi:predicted short-subunit dehydrogenase-like oxidoreductase (DUF2520 family)
MQGRLSIVGGGRVGRALGRRLHAAGCKIGVVAALSEASSRRAVRFIGAGKASAGLTRQIISSGVILIAVPDHAVVAVAQELARIGAEELRGKIVLHTSGALDSSALDAVRKHGAAAGSMHPLQSFSGVGVPPLEGRVFAIEGDAAAVKVARNMARMLGGSPVQIDGGAKVLYHAAASMAAGQILAVEEAATRMMTASGMKRREAIRALLPLTRQVLENFERLGAAAAWTGPLSRGDYNVVAAHTAAMHGMPVEFAEAYLAINRLAARILSQDSAGTLAALEKIGEGKKARAKAIGGKA